MYGELKLETKKSGQVVGCCYTYINGEERIDWLKTYAESLNITESLACRSLLNAIITEKMVLR